MAGHSGSVWDFGDGRYAQPAMELSASKLVPITKSDSTDLTSSNIRMLWIGGAGDVAVIASDDSAAVTIASVAAGTLLRIAVKKVMSTNTTATNIIGLA
jgi:hypothetical protein